MPPRPRPAKKPTAKELVERMAVPGAPGKDKERLQFEAPALEGEIDAFERHRRARDEHESKMRAHEAKILAAAAPARVEACRRTGKAEASIVVNGRLVLTQKCQFSPVHPDQLPSLAGALGTDAERYFVPQLSIELTRQDEPTLQAIMDALGPKKFQEVFRVTRTCRVTQEFYEDWTLRPEVAERAAPFIDAEVIKPVKASLRPA